MRLIERSDFGSSFFVPDRITDNRNFGVRQQWRNWQPENFVYGLILISISLQNIVSSLKVINGVKATEVEFSWPEDDVAFELPWKSVGGSMEFGEADVIRPEHITAFAKDDILDAYREEPS